jgi:hypothetical protein
MSKRLKIEIGCTALKFVHKSGDVLYPSEKLDSRTGRVCWTVARPGTGNNTKNQEIPVFDEATLIEYVVKMRYSVRCRSTDGKRTGLYNPDGHSVILEYTATKPVRTRWQPQPHQAATIVLLALAAALALYYLWRKLI